MDRTSMGGGASVGVELGLKPAVYEVAEACCIGWEDGEHILSLTGRGGELRKRF